MNKRVCLGILAVSAAVLLTGCRSTLYSAYESFGVYKRDLLKKRVVAARDESKEAGEQFKDALTRPREMYGSSGSNLEKAYDKLQSEYDQSVSKADAVKKRVRDMETVARDLFDEWEKEIKQITSESMRATSRDQLRQTRDRYEDMHAALKRAERSMEPVLVKFRDHVLSLKHSLNAQAIASLKGEAVSIEQDIGRLIADMNASIKQADEFIRQMP
jgi:ElaB/YqjD/DUF883 family membrane-anchored ribosome-binding protein